MCLPVWRAVRREFCSILVCFNGEGEGVKWHSFVVTPDICVKSVGTRDTFLDLYVLGWNRQAVGVFYRHDFVFEAGDKF